MVVTEEKEITPVDYCFIGVVVYKWYKFSSYDWTHGYIDGSGTSFFPIEDYDIVKLY